MHREVANDALEISNYEINASILTLNTLIEILGKIVESGTIDLAISNVMIQLSHYINFEKAIFLKKKLDKEDYYEMHSSFGFEENQKFNSSYNNERSIVWCTEDIGSSLIVDDISKDMRFDPNEVFELKSKMSVISYLLKLNEEKYGVLLFYTDLLDHIKLLGCLEKISRITKIILPYLNTRLSNERELKQAYQKIEEEKNYAHKLLQMVGHDINNALTVVIGNSLIGMMKKKDDPECMSRWQKNHKAALMISEIIDTVKTMQILEREKQSLKLETILLDEVVSSTQFIFEEKLNQKKVKLVYRSSPEHIFLAEKKSFKNQVFNNIISNAIKFSNEGGEIVVECENRTHDIHIQIKDFGIGIPEDILSNLFVSKRKSTRIGTGGEVGTGFGVLLVKSYMEMYGGRVEVESRDILKFPDNHGTIFHLYLKK